MVSLIYIKKNRCQNFQIFGNLKAAKYFNSLKTPFKNDEISLPILRKIYRDLFFTSLQTKLNFLVKFLSNIVILGYNVTNIKKCWQTLRQQNDLFPFLTLMLLMIRKYNYSTQFSENKNLALPEKSSPVCYFFDRDKSVPILFLMPT